MRESLAQKIDEVILQNAYPEWRPDKKKTALKKLIVPDGEYRYHFDEMVKFDEGGEWWFHHELMSQLQSSLLRACKGHEGMFKALKPGPSTCAFISVEVWISFFSAYSN
jgi:hypothetical protein